MAKEEYVPRKYPRNERVEETRFNAKRELEYIITSANERATFTLYIPDGRAFKKVCKGKNPIVVRKKYAEMLKDGTLNTI